mgnify:CR=1 FL=1
MKQINNEKKLEDLKKKFDKNLIKKSALLSLKPKIIVCNVDEKSLPDGNKYSDACKKKFPNENIIVVCADIEDQIMSLQTKDLPRGPMANDHPHANHNSMDVPIQNWR